MLKYLQIDLHRVNQEGMNQNVMRAPGFTDSSFVAETEWICTEFKGTHFNKVTFFFFSSHKNCLWNSAQVLNTELQVTFHLDSDRTRRNGFKLGRGRFRLDIRRNFFT